MLYVLVSAYSTQSSARNTQNLCEICPSGWFGVNLECNASHHKIPLKMHLILGHTIRLKFLSPAPTVSRASVWVMLLMLVLTIDLDKIKTKAKSTGRFIIELFYSKSQRIKE